VSLVHYICIMMFMMRSLTPVNLALTDLLSQLNTMAVAHSVPIAQALGCVLAKTIVAEYDVPAFPNSAMDGYALCLGNLAQHSGLIVSQTVAAGHPGEKLEQGTCARIFTGAPIPDGADAVVMQENVTVTDSGVQINQLPKLGENIRLQGHDIKKGAILLEAGRRLQPQDLGLLAAQGFTEVSVLKPLTVALLNTGDEVVMPGQALAPGHVYDSNSFVLEALLERLGVQVIRRGIVADTLHDTQAAIKEAAQVADCLITTGGVSVGEADNVRPAVESMGNLSIWKLAIKPGKPFSFGHVLGIPFFGLPGNPVAVFVTFVILVRPALLKMQGAKVLELPHYRLPIGVNVKHAGTRDEYLRVRLIEGVLQPFRDQGSSLLSSLSWADGLAIIPAMTTPKVGDKVDFIPFTGVY
jgi:molybdopterin molybdotransferase